MPHHQAPVQSAERAVDRDEAASGAGTEVQGAGEDALPRRFAQMEKDFLNIINFSLSFCRLGRRERWLGWVVSSMLHGSVTQLEADCRNNPPLFLEGTISAPLGCCEAAIRMGEASWQIGRRERVESSDLARRSGWGESGSPACFAAS